MSRYISFILVVCFILSFNMVNSKNNTDIFCILTYTLVRNHTHGKFNFTIYGDVKQKLLTYSRKTLILLVQFVREIHQYCGIAKFSHNDTLSYIILVEIIYRKCAKNWGKVEFDMRACTFSNGTNISTIPIDIPTKKVEAIVITKIGNSLSIPCLIAFNYNLLYHWWIDDTTWKNCHIVISILSFCSYHPICQRFF